MQAIEHAMPGKNVPGQFSLSDRYGAKVLYTLTIRLQTELSSRAIASGLSIGTVISSRYRRSLDIKR